MKERDGIGYNSSDIRQMNRAMRLSLGIGIFMLLLKTYAYMITGSAAIFSDAAESIVHVLAVGFAVYSMWLSLKPADRDHPFGHDRITFFSAGFEGAMIILAAFFIIYQAIDKWIQGLTLENIDEGISFIAIAMVINGVLGFYLVLKGKKYQSIVLEADGKHILTDCFTSLGVIIGLILTRVTNWLPFDPIVAILVGLNILWTGAKLIRNSIRGLMDEVDVKIEKKIRDIIDQEVFQFGIHYHHMRYRNSGNRLFIEVHFLFPNNLSIAEAHEIATRIEEKIVNSFPTPVEFFTHLEPEEGHDEVHISLLGRMG